MARHDHVAVRNLIYMVPAMIITLRLLLAAEDGALANPAGEHLAAASLGWMERPPNVPRSRRLNLFRSYSTFA